MGNSIKKHGLVLGAQLLIFLLFFTSFSFAEEEVTGNIQFINSRLYYDRGTKQSYLDVQIKNISPTVTLNAPIQVVIESITPNTITVANPDGASGGKPYFSYNVTLSPGQTSTAKRWKFSNPGQLRFTYSFAAWANTQAANTPPVANAGPDQTVYVGTTVTLDGSLSSDFNGNPLTFKWSILSRPGGSGAALSNTTAVKPTFYVDKYGTYVIQLIVNDGTVDSAPNTVTISTQNSAPVANAGPDQTIHGGEPVYLDGSLSSDVDGNPLTYRWSFTSRPAGSSAILNGANMATPDFSADEPGDYVIQLIVNDGIVDSAPDTVKISNTNSAPVANAGPDQNVLVTSPVNLNGSASSDADGDSFTYFWAITSQPGGSGAALSDPTAVKPSFTADLEGTYVIQLIVDDGWDYSAPDTVTVISSSIPNTPPVANAGPDQTAYVNNKVILDGSGSIDADGNPLTYRWSFILKPANSNAVISNPTTVYPTFVMDKAGTFEVQLIVNDGKVDSVPDTVSITTGNSAPLVNAGADQTITLPANAYLTGSVTDDGLPLGGSLTIAWSKFSGPGTVTFSDPNAVVASAGFSAPGTYVLRLTAGDSALSADDDVQIMVQVAVVTLDPVTDQTVPTNVALSLRLTGHSTDPLAALTYRLVSGPTGAEVTAPGVFSFTPSQGQIGGPQAVTAEVQDGEGLSAQRTFQIMVVDHNHPPVLGPLPDDITTVGASYTKTLSATDPDPGDTLTFALLSGPAGMTLTGNRLTWTPTGEQLGNWPVQVQVTDQAGASDSGKFHVGLSLVSAKDDRYSVFLGQTLNVSAPGVLTNDSSPAGGGPLSAYQPTSPDKGTLNAFGADGSFSYTAPPSLPAPPVLDAKVKWNAGPASFVSQGLHSLLVGDIDGDGNPDVFIANSANGLMAMKGDGTSLFDFTGLLPAAGLHCYADVFYGEAALADLDGDGKAEMIVPVHCMEDDDLRNPYSIGNSNRVAALSYDPTAPGHLRVKWISPTTSNHSSGAHLTNYVHFTVARLSPGEPPSVLWGRDFPSGGGTCADIIPGKTDAFCRVVTVHSGIDGSISQRLYYAPPNQTSPGTWGWEQQRLGGFGAPIVADLTGTGQASILFNGTVWDRAGNVRLELDGTGSPSTANDSVVVDLDGDGQPDILTLNNAFNSYVHDSALRAYRTDGTLLWQLPVPQASAGRMSVADVDRDGRPEILFFSDNQLWCVDHAGHIKWIHVFGVYGDWNVNSGLITRTPVYDLNGDGLPKVIVQYGNNGLLFLRGDTGQTELSWKIPGDEFGQPYNGAQEPIVADLDGDGQAEIVFLHMASAHAPNGVVAIQGDTVPWRAAPKAFNQRAFNGVNINANGSIPLQPLTYWTNAATNVFEQPPPEPYVVDPRLATQTSFTYAAGIGIPESAPATVTIDIVAANRPPVVTSKPPASVNIGTMTFTSPFTYQITAYDPDPGDTLSYAVSLRGCGSPTIVTVSSSGLFSYKDYWQPTGLCTYIVDVADNHGAVTQHTFTIFFTSLSENKTVPNLVGQDAKAAPGRLAAVDLQVGVVTHVDNSAPAGQVLSQNPVSGTSVLKRSIVDFVVSNGPSLPPLPPGPPPQLGNLARIVVEPASALRLVGETIPFKAIGVYNDGTGADLTAAVTWSSSQTSVATINATGSAQSAGAGTTAVTATANGLTASATLTVASRTPGDPLPPTALITAPADGGNVTGLTQIIGTANDPNFLRYELAVALAGETSWTVIGEGGTAVTAGTLGTLDPTTLINDLYTLRLRVFDRNGNETAANVTVQVTGRQKPGLFTLTYQDLNLPAAGIPVTVTRTYDSRDKGKGDFGIGWRLGLQTLRLRTNRVPGTGWVRNISGAIVRLVPTSEHKVSLTLPDGKVEEFDLLLSPTSGFGGLDFTAVTGYAPRPGTLGKLEMLDNPYLAISNAGLEAELVDDTTLNTFEPQRYRYTTLDGTQIEIHRKEGVQKVTDTNGNTVTFGPAGIIHSSGKSIVFTRDGQGRITQITDPMGNVQTYAYDGNGDLVSRTTATGDVSRYGYDHHHGLIDIQDPAGNHAARNEYDDAGRLIATTDAKGNKITFTRDLAARREVVTDRLGNPTIYTYDAAGNITTKTDALGQATTYTFDSRNNQLTETDPLGRVAGKTYDSKNNVLTSTDFNGNTTTSTYNANGKLLTRTDPEGHTTTNVYDAGGNITQITDPEGGLTRHTYDAAGNRLRTTDPLGNVTTRVYDGSGNKTSETDPLGVLTTFTYDANGNALSETKGGRTTRFQYDTAQRRIRTIDPIGQPIVTVYSAVGDGKKPASVTDVQGKITNFEYDVRGSLIKTTFPDGSTMTTTDDNEGRTLSKTDRDGRPTAFQYDALGRQTNITNPDGTAIIQTYDPVGRLLSQTNERGYVTTYSNAPNKQTVTDALGNVTVHEFDSQQRRIRTVDALGRITAFAYDSKGNLTSTIFPNGSSKTTTYDTAGRKVRETDQAGFATQLAYDAAGRLIQVTNAAGDVTSQTYDALGNGLTQTDANRHTTQMTYDVLGRVTNRTRPLGQFETFAYDAYGNPISHTDFNSQTTTFAYDTNNRLTSKTLPGGIIVSYAYLPGGPRTQAGGDTFTYDVRGRLIRETKASGDRLIYIYDAAGNRTTVTTPQGTTSYTYDALNRLATVVNATGTTTYGYDAVGNLASTAYPNGVTTTYTYDTLNRLVQMTNTGTSGLISSYTYTLGPAGNRLQVVEAGPATTGRVVAYTYDAVYRLTREQIDEPGTINDQMITYTYDAVGNRTQMNRNGVITTYTYDANDRLLTEVSSAGTFVSTYDNNGNLKTRGNGPITDSYTYDAEDRLISATVQTGTNPGSVTYAYDADGMRTGKAVGGIATTFLLDKNRDHAQVLVETSGSTVVTYTYGHDLISQTRPGTGTSFYQYDGQLSTRQLTNTTGTVTDTYAFDAFGVLLTSTGTTPNVYLFTGEQLDPNIGFYYLRARYYAQALGRFITTDPEMGSIFDPVSLHRYLYANANPVTFADPSGRFIQLLLPAIAVLMGIDTVIGFFSPLVMYAIIGEYHWKDIPGLVIEMVVGGVTGAISGVPVGGPIIAGLINVIREISVLHFIAKKDVYFYDVDRSIALNIFVGVPAGIVTGGVAQGLVQAAPEYWAGKIFAIINKLTGSKLDIKQWVSKQSLGSEDKVFWRHADFWYPVPHD